MRVGRARGRERALRCAAVRMVRELYGREPSKTRIRSHDAYDNTQARNTSNHAHENRQTPIQRSALPTIERARERSNARRSAKSERGPAEPPTRANSRAPRAAPQMATPSTDPIMVADWKAPSRKRRKAGSRKSGRKRLGVNWTMGNCQAASIAT